MANDASTRELFPWILLLEGRGGGRLRTLFGRFSNCFPTVLPRVLVLVGRQHTARRDLVPALVSQHLDLTRKMEKIEI
jgi:hypothetical protein